MTFASVTFAGLVERHRSELLVYITRLLGNPEHAEDLCQETFLRAYRSFPRLKTHNHLRAWLYKIATRASLNHSRDLRRREQRRVDRDPDMLSVDPGPMGGANEDTRDIARLVRSLPKKQRAALVLRILEDLPYEQIGQILECSASAARANVYQAMEKLRVRFRKEGRAS